MENAKEESAMAHCRKCGREIREDFILCPYCGAQQISDIGSERDTGSDAYGVVKALREIYAHYGAQQTLGNNTLLYNALGDKLGDDGKKTAEPNPHGHGRGAGQAVPEPAAAAHARL